ncbi:BA75_05243T0 [Komagataella pastoris]|uniref:BA75_05243T0 n=1 Tax=Komagataella pastoris TaxID=4922 RepID=A0A1B2JJF0_PICPA|nr:BA75_05243T0 [Komagataella pastoris]
MNEKDKVSNSLPPLSHLMPMNSMGMKNEITSENGSSVGTTNGMVPTAKHSSSASTPLTSVHNNNDESNNGNISNHANSFSSVNGKASGSPNFHTVSANFPSEEPKYYYSTESQVASQVASQLMAVPQMPGQLYPQGMNAQFVYPQMVPAPPPPPQPPQIDQNKLYEKCSCKNSTNRIPRPRNAFILFRQKNHQALLEEGNVIRTNPEVSRELGRRWRNLSPEEKSYWNKSAEEEKRRHAERYPGYKYTPRRSSKKNCPSCKAKQAMKTHSLNVQSYYAQYPSASAAVPVPMSNSQKNMNNHTAQMQQYQQMHAQNTPSMQTQYQQMNTMQHGMIPQYQQIPNGQGHQFIQPQQHPQPQMHPQFDGSQFPQTYMVAMPKGNSNEAALAQQMPMVEQPTLFSNDRTGRAGSLRKLVATPLPGMNGSTNPQSVVSNTVVPDSYHQTQLVASGQKALPSINNLKNPISYSEVQ